MVAVGLVFVVFWFVFCFCFCVVFSVLVFPLLPACLSSFTDWCLVHRQQSREQKKHGGSKCTKMWIELRRLYKYDVSTLRSGATTGPLTLEDLVVDLKQVS